MIEKPYFDISADQMRFAVFCTGALAERLGIREEKMFDMLENNNIFKDYIFDLYDILHTQSQEYIVDDIIDFMKTKGIVL